MNATDINTVLGLAGSFVLALTFMISFLRWLSRPPLSPAPSASSPQPKASGDQPAPPQWGAPGPAES